MTEPPNKNILNWTIIIAIVAILTFIFQVLHGCGTNSNTKIKNNSINLSKHHKINY